MTVSELKGVGPKKTLALEKMGIRNLEDLIYFFPRDYQDRRHVKLIAQLEVGEAALIRGKVQRIMKDGYRRGRKQVLRLIIEDTSAAVEVVFFNAGFLASNFKVGQELFFYGKPTVSRNKIQLVHPEFDGNDGVQGILPLYSLTKGISQNEMRKWQKEILPLGKTISDVLPPTLVKGNNLCPLDYALENIHFPQGPEQLRQAKYRFIFEELFILALGLVMMKKKDEKGIAFGGTEAISEFIGQLPYTLTTAQSRVIEEIQRDMEREMPMNRLVQGDVGSGKTVVAAMALYKAVKSGFQGAFMAPTDLLMRQHYHSLKATFAPLGVKVGYLSGNMSSGEKKKTLEELSSGEIQILVGTHAMIQPTVNFHKLGLVITDEQHRFGVNQRISLYEKGKHPDVLVMTATPIPRTLAVVIYGDMDVSVIDQLPPGRQKILTKAVGTDAREKVYRFVEEEVEKGRQAYVVAPLIEESETLDVRSATEVYKELKKKFAKYNVAILHGEMKQQEKDGIMERFYRGDIHILVATVVIEVGIDVPNATVMVIENAERFGLAQLHQLRGRVGRGKEQSYCVLISASAGDVARERAEIMAGSNDGFYIAEKDLELRGPGEIFGSRQHGIPDMCLADLVKHMDIMEKVRSEAFRLLELHPGLEGEALLPLKAKVEEFFGRTGRFSL
ncbi:MAG: ATP-dependent DNA helicase RecG [Anaerovoracaceae bacterium]|jgi:ATP-dependent DNA helicase RecG